jgi:hypothetical protein
MQERRSQRAVAALVAAVLIFVGWLGAHHRAEVAHVHDGSGSMVHAAALADHHASDSAAHVHGRSDHQDAPGACTLLATLIARPAAASAVAVIADASILPAAPPALAFVPPALAAYRLAPKTSPPLARA